MECMKCKATNCHYYEMNFCLFWKMFILNKRKILTNFLFRQSHKMGNELSKLLISFSNVNFSNGQCKIDRSLCSCHMDSHLTKCGFLNILKLFMKTNLRVSLYELTLYDLSLR